VIQRRWVSVNSEKPITIIEIIDKDRECAVVLKRIDIDLLYISRQAVFSALG
jgi:hypothetical protein